MVKVQFTCGRPAMAVANRTTAIATVTCRPFTPCPSAAFPSKDRSLGTAKSAPPPWPSPTRAGPTQTKRLSVISTLTPPLTTNVNPLRFTNSSTEVDFIWLGHLAVGTIYWTGLTGSPGHVLYTHKPRPILNRSLLPAKKIRHTRAALLVWFFLFLRLIWWFLIFLYEISNAVIFFSFLFFQATVDINDRCTMDHTGTSAAAPLAAGIIALALEAKYELGADWWPTWWHACSLYILAVFSRSSNLTWRDVQHITAWTSEYYPLKDNLEWQENAFGLRYNPRFGFGLMNADRFVRTAANWTAVPGKSICSINNLSE